MMRTRLVRHGRRGFTLLEILIVIGIIALLAALVVPSYMGTQRDAEIKTTVGSVGWGGALAGQLEIYRTHVGEYPKELKFLTEAPPDEEQAKKWRGPYITDPGSLKDAWGHDLKYAAGEDAQNNKERYDLSSLGPDGQEGTDDDITNWHKG